MAINYRSITGRQKLINGMKSYLRNLANRRNSGVVTADDAHSYLSRMGINELMVRTRLSFINTVFGNGDFAPVGTVSSARPQAKGRSISTWTVA
jgi:hypothetical protein